MLSVRTISAPPASCISPPTRAVPAQAVTPGVSAFTGETDKGGLDDRNGTITPPGNTFPPVTVPAGFTIPLRTPFALPGSATDAEGGTGLTDPVSVPDGLATIATAVGLDPRDAVTPPAGRPIALRDGGTPIRAVLSG